MRFRNSAGSARDYVFSLVPDASIPRCRMKRPSTHKTTVNANLLYPLFWDEVLPGDTFQLDVSCVAHMTTLLAPIMDNVYMDWQFYFVPNRLVWNDWQRMCGEQEDPDQSTDVSVPYVTAPEGGLTAGSLGDYFGLPLGVVWGNHDVQALPFRAYNLIWNEWYRDENLQDPVTLHKDGTTDSISDFVLLPRGKRKDYFTGALPWPQKGPAVTIPLGQSAPVGGNGNSLGLTDGTNGYGLFGYTHNSVDILSKNAFDKAVGDSVATSNYFGTTGKAIGITTDSSKSGLVADLSSVEGASINAIRQAFQLQKLLERDARGGTRYVEILRSHFNVVSPDARLQRPEFLGSFTVPVNVHTVVQNSESGTTPQGTLAGVGTVQGSNRAFTKSFVEHGIILGLCSIRADLSYQQGIPRKFSRSTRFDYFWPALAHLGEQAILNKEIFAQNASVVDASGLVVNNKAFGYQERWSEYKYGHNLITGDLRSTASAPLDFWHLAQKFDNLPTLNEDFIKEQVPLDRVLALSSEQAPQFVMDMFFDLVCVRPMPLYDVPGLIDHF